MYPPGCVLSTKRLRESFFFGSPESLSTKRLRESFVPSLCLQNACENHFSPPYCWSLFFFAYSHLPSPTSLLPPPSVQFTSLQFTSVQFTSVHFTSLHFSLLHIHITSLQFTSLSVQGSKGVVRRISLGVFCLQNACENHLFSVHPSRCLQNACENHFFRV